MNGSPCFDCPKRKVGCHTNCEEYQYYVRELDAMRKAKDEYNDRYYSSAHAKRSERKNLMHK